MDLDNVVDHWLNGGTNITHWCVCTLQAEGFDRITDASLPNNDVCEESEGCVRFCFQTQSMYFLLYTIQERFIHTGRVG